MQKRDERRIYGAGGKVPASYFLCENSLEEWRIRLPY